MITTLLLASLALADTPPPPPVVGGAATSDFAAVGALVALDSRGDIAGSFCSGTLIGRQMVLTAAHCIDGLLEIQAMGYRDFEFVIGTDVHTSAGAWERIALSEWFQHPQWDPTGYENDLAMVRLADPSELALPALLHRPGPDAGWQDTLIRYVGWGKADDSEADTSGIKRTVDVPFYDLYDLVFLTHDPNNRNVCYGDSGGAAFITDEDGAMRLAGVNSFIFSLDGGSPMCASAQSAAGAARVDKYLEWIGIYVDIEAVEEEVEAELSEAEEIPGEQAESEPVQETVDADTQTPEFARSALASKEASAGCAIVAAAPHLGLSLFAMLGLVRRRG
jgi:secreted trypsin-like serine protease